MTQDVRTSRIPFLAEKIVFVDGQPGCGKTMLSALLPSFERVEILSYAYEIEYVCSLQYLGKIEPDAAVTMVRLLTDLRLYNLMMSRDVNFRPSDLSSVFRDPSAWRYLKRLWAPGDEHVPARIAQERPVLNFTTHGMTAFSEPILKGLEGRVVFIELVRHPLYMLKQQKLNMDNFAGRGSLRDFSIYHNYNGQDVPYYVKGWEAEFLKANSMERAIRCISGLYKLTESRKATVLAPYRDAVLTIPFEHFVRAPELYIERIEALLGTRITGKTRKLMRKHRLPRVRLADSINLPIYKRCGWVPPQACTEEEEFARRRCYAAKEAGAEAMRLLDEVCRLYEEKYIAGR
jgi:hypothetical protein